MARKSRTAKRLRSVLSYSMFLLTILIITMVVQAFVVEKNVVVGESMEPTLHEGNQIITSKLNYKLGDVERFDVVVFPSKMNHNVYLIKRVIGLPGETVRIDNEGNIFVNDKLLTENYGSETIEDAGLALAGITVPFDKYFVLGDNRNKSTDSRYVEVGMVDRECITGKAVLRIWPLGQAGGIR